MQRVCCSAARELQASIVRETCVRSNSLSSPRAHALEETPGRQTTQSLPLFLSSSISTNPLSFRALHKRKDGLKCPFFTVPQPADFEEPVLSDDDAAPAEEEEADEELQEEEEDDDGGIRLVESSPDKGPDPVAHKRASRTGGKQSVASSAKGLPTSKSRGKLKVQEEESVAGDEVVDEVRSRVFRDGRGRSGNGS